MKLFYMPGVCSLSPHITLRESGLAFDLEKVDRATKKTDKGTDYMGISPRGYVPALQLDNGDILTEGPAIVQYVADQVPDKKLAPPAGTMARYKLMEWLNVVSSEIHKGFSPLFMPNVSAESKEAVKERLLSRLGSIDKHMAGRDYVMDTFSVVDPYLFTTLRWTVPLKIDLTPFPNLVAFFERMKERPAVKAALAAEGLN